MKLQKVPTVNHHQIKIMRLGDIVSVHPAVVVNHIDTLRDACSTYLEFSNLCESVNVVAVTCAGVHHPILQRKAFDLCIIDEASQITEVECLGSLMRAKAFALVGDHHQLPPLVQSHAARALGMDNSLFRRLFTTFPEDAVYLTRQYRMNADLCKLSNALVYGGRLKCANDGIATRQLQLPKPLLRMDATDVFCFNVLAPSKPVVFVNTDSTNCGCENSEGTNLFEAALVAEMVKRLVSAGVAAQHIGVMTPFRSQLRLIKVIHHHHYYWLPKSKVDCVFIHFFFD